MVEIGDTIARRVAGELPAAERLAQPFRATRRRSDTGTLPEFVLLGKRVTTRAESYNAGADIAQLVANAVLEENMDSEGVPVLTVSVIDPDYDVQRSGLIRKGATAELDGKPYTLVGHARTGSILELTFEDEVVSRLRANTEPMKVFRQKWTRAQFIRRMIAVESPRIPFYCPQLRDVQRVGVADPALEELGVAGSGADGGTGGFNATNLQVQDAGGNRSTATADQLKIAARSLAVAASLKAPRKAALALIEACMVESNLTNVTYGDSSSVGVLQLLDSHLGGSTSTNGGRRDVELVCKMFLEDGFTDGRGAIELARENSSMSAGQIAQSCQGSAHPERYDAVADVCEKIVDAYDGTAFVGDEGGVASQRYAFAKGAPDGEDDENSWTCGRRLADEVRWRLFATRGVVIYASDGEMVRAKPSLKIRPNMDGVLSELDHSADVGASVDTMDVVLHAGRYAVKLGVVVEVEGTGPEGADPPELADGRWLIAGVRRSVFDERVEARLSRPRAALPEPAAATETIATGDSEVGSTTSALSDVYVSGEWGGAKSVFDQFVTPFLRERGLSPGSTKEQRSNASSDHDVDNTTAYATDYPTYSGENAARELASAIGWTDWAPNSYDAFTLTVSGVSFRTQILWGASIDHADHVHVGMRRL